ncbi:hypothetical protein ColTof3_07804 [Colletotrichum tofieldiae]|nr:hypothetical protein ColTof3_07804 [Colletotrichum tofieldiae]
MPAFQSLRPAPILYLIELGNVVEQEKKTPRETIPLLALLARANTNNKEMSYLVLQALASTRAG